LYSYDRQHVDAILDIQAQIVNFCAASTLNEKIEEITNLVHGNIYKATDGKHHLWTST
jgi:hypothetical protein